MSEPQSGWADERQVRELLRRRGVRRTAQRVAVLLLLATAYEAEDAERQHRDTERHSERHSTHLTSRQIHERLESRGADIDLATVYRTVQRLEEAGVVHSTLTAQAVTYGLSEDPHHHAVCTGCGTVTEIATDELGAAVDPILAAAGLSAGDAGLTVHGLCATCATTS